MRFWYFVGSNLFDNFTKSDTLVFYYSDDLRLNHFDIFTIWDTLVICGTFDSIKVNYIW